MHASNIQASGEGPGYFARYKARDLLVAARNTGRLAAGQRVLDFGAGTGAMSEHLHAELERPFVVGVDVSMRSLEIARQRNQAGDWVCFDGDTLPFANGSFDWAIAACVFHHIDAAQHVELLAEIRRVLKPGGGLMVYEHNPWNPLTRRAVDTCPFDENACLISLPRMRERFRLAGFPRPQAHYRVFFPRVLAHLRGLESRLGWLALGAQYYVFATKQ
jgi:ubiquinone/menaquinone biosynthesis C-methylase UbiE